MGAVTYPQPEVVQLVTERFIPMRFNIKEHHPDFKEALGQGKVLWCPLFVYRDGRGSELRRSVGFLPADEFLAELKLVLGLAALTHGRIDEALSCFDGAAAEFPETSAAPEALYWAAAAIYRTGGVAAVIRRWDDLVARYPESTWARRADVIPPEMRGKAHDER